MVKKSTLLSLSPIPFLIAGIALGIILIINLMNGTYLETVYPYSYIPSDPELYPFYQPPALNETYHYTTITDTGELIFKICAACFSIGILLVIIPAAVQFYKKYNP